MRRRVEIDVDQPPLTTTGEPDARGSVEQRGECLQVGHRATSRVQDLQPLDARPTKLLDRRPSIVGSVFRTGGRDQHYAGVGDILDWRR